MEIAMLAMVFIAAVVVSACVVLTFAVPMDIALFRVISGGVEDAWSLYAKFAVFVASFIGGLRLQEIQAFAVPAVSTGQQQISISASRCLLEVYKTIAGALSVASWILLVFFGATLTAYVVLHVYNSMKPAIRQSRESEHRASVAAGRY